MFYKIISFIVLISLATVTQIFAAQNSYLNLTGETQADSSDNSVQQGRVMLDSDSNEVGGDGENIGTPSTEQTGYVDPKTGLIIENIGDTGDPDQPIITGSVPNDTTEMNKADLTEVQASPPQANTGIEHDDIGITSDNNKGTEGTSPADNQVAPSQIKVLILAPSAKDNSSTHDPGITILESLAALGIDDDDFGFVSNGEVYVRSGYLKIGDIKGESSDAAGIGGDGDIILTGGYSGKKPKEIVVVGSKTTDKSSPKLLEAVCDGVQATCVPQDAVTPERLTDYAQRTVNTYDSIKEIRLDDSKVEMQAFLPFKLFGFIPMRLKQTMSVSVTSDSFGRVKVKFPWYHSLGRKTVRPHDLMANLETGVATAQFSKWEVADIDASKDDSTSGPAGEEIMADETGQADDIPTENVTFNFSEVKAQLLQTMSNLIVQYQESDLNFIQR
jgi:hypothetical protein